MDQANNEINFDNMVVKINLKNQQEAKTILRNMRNIAIKEKNSYMLSIYYNYQADYCKYYNKEYCYKYLMKSISICNFNFGSFIKMGEYFYEKGNLTKSFKYFLKAFELIEKEYGGINCDEYICFPLNKLLIYLCKICIKSNYSEFNIFFEKIFQLENIHKSCFKKHFNISYDLAYDLIKRNYFFEAKKYLKHLISKSNAYFKINDPTIFLLLSSVCFKLGLFKESKKHASTFLKATEIKIKSFGKGKGTATP